MLDGVSYGAQTYLFSRAGYPGCIRVLPWLAVVEIQMAPSAQIGHGMEETLLVDSEEVVAAMEHSVENFETAYMDWIAAVLSSVGGSVAKVLLSSMR